MDRPRTFSSSVGCLNPLCPRANWSEAHLPRWWLRLDDGQISEFAACDDACAEAAVRIIQARLGHTNASPRFIHTPAVV